jgi:hypothetical protein
MQSVEDFRYRLRDGEVVLYDGAALGALAEEAQRRFTSPAERATVAAGRGAPWRATAGR